jgi:hypothetical protein
MSKSTVRPHQQVQIIQPVTHLWSPVEPQDPEAHILDVLLRHTEDAEPSWWLRQWNIQLSRGKIDTGTSNSFRLVAHKHVRPQRVVHVVPVKEQGKILFQESYLRAASKYNLTVTKTIHTTTFRMRTYTLWQHKCKLTLLSLKCI